MKATGIVRKVDGLGRVVLPIELRRTFGIEEKDPLEIYVDEEKIILKKYEPGCYCCKSMSNLIDVYGLPPMCPECFGRYQKAAVLLQKAK